jgi:hypothetical protein
MYMVLQGGYIKNEAPYATFLPSNGYQLAGESKCSKLMSKLQSAHNTAILYIRPNLAMYIVI